VGDGNTCKVASLGYTGPETKMQNVFKELSLFYESILLSHVNIMIADM